MKTARSAILFALALLAACSDAAPRTSQTPTPTPTTASPAASGRREATGVAYLSIAADTARSADQFDLWLYDIASDQVRRLTSDGKRTIESHPRFRGDRITFAEDRKRLVELDPSTGQRRMILAADDTILAYAWSADGRRVAYIDVNYERGSVHHLRVHDVVTGRTSELKTLGSPLGRGTHDDDEVSVAWNRAGTRLLINDTHLDEFATVRVISVADGSDVIAPVEEATNAVFSADERSILLRLIPESAERKWIKVDLTSGSRDPVPVPPKTYHAALSPDGRRIAVLRSGSARNAFAVEVYDIATGRRVTRASGYRDPIWLSNDSLAATRIADCPRGDGDCEYYGWRGVGTRKIHVSGSTEAIKLGTTLWEGSRVDVKF